MKTSDRLDVILSGGGALALVAFSFYGMAHRVCLGDPIPANSIRHGGGWSVPQVELIVVTSLLGIGLGWRAVSKWRDGWRSRIRTTTC